MPERMRSENWFFSPRQRTDERLLRSGIRKQRIHVIYVHAAPRRTDGPGDKSVRRQQFAGWSRVHVVATVRIYYYCWGEVMGFVSRNLSIIYMGDDERLARTKTNPRKCPAKWYSNNTKYQCFFCRGWEKNILYDAFVDRSPFAEIIRSFIFFFRSI